MATRDINIQRRSSGRQINLRVLLDLDQVLADFEGHFLKEFRRKYPNEPYVDLEHREGFFIREQYEQIKPGLGVGISLTACDLCAQRRQVILLDGWMS